MKLEVYTPEYRNFMCWKYDSDQMSSSWDMANQSQKSGGHVYLSRGIYSAKYGIQAKSGGK